MTKDFHHLLHRTAVREVHLEQLEADLVGLQGYRQALVVFRLRDAVVGQAWLPVLDGRIPLARLRASLPAVALPAWKRLMAPDPDPLQPLPTASVVVCTRDRTAELAQCLESLLPLATQGHEVIVVDNRPSDDSTARLVATYPTIRYVREPRPGLNVARNRGLLAATGEIVAFTDDDAIVDPGWLSALLRNFDDPLVAVVTGIVMPLELETLAQAWFERSNSFQRGFERRSFDATNLHVLAVGAVGAGANMAIRHSATEQVGLFDEALGVGTPSCAGGENEFFERVVARGYRIVYEPAALVWHRHRREWSALRRTIYGYGVGVFAWWTHALLVNRELTVLKEAPRWFWRHHVRNLVRTLLSRPGRVHLDLVLAEFLGALAGPVSYLRSRRWLRKQKQIARVSHVPDLVPEQTPIPATAQESALFGKGLEAP